MTLEACIYLKNLSDERNIANAPTSRGTPFADSDGTMWQETILLARRSVENSNAPKKATGESGPQAISKRLSARMIHAWYCGCCHVNVNLNLDNALCHYPMGLRSRRAVCGANCEWGDCFVICPAPLLRRCKRWASPLLVQKAMYFTLRGNRPVRSPSFA